MKPIKYDLFLIGRNYDVDYKAIVIPDCLSKVDGSYTLTEATGNISLTEDNVLFTRQIYTDNIEPFTIIFRVIKIEKSALKESSSIEVRQDKTLNEINSNLFLEDEFGREIYLVEGVLLQSVDTENFYIDSKVLDQLHNYLMNYFKNFWEGDLETKIIDSKINFNSNLEDCLTIKNLGILDLKTRIKTKKNFLVRKTKVIIFIFIIFLLTLQSLIIWRNCSGSLRKDGKLTRKSLCENFKKIEILFSGG